LLIPLTSTIWIYLFSPLNSPFSSAIKMSQNIASFKIISMNIFSIAF
jgi:hypothetical protein